MSTDEASELAAVHAFLRRFEQDRANGTQRTAAEYAALFPAHAAAVEREHAALAGAVAAGGAAGDAAGAAPAPLRIGPYQVVRELGRGGQAVVYLARDDRLQREVALKVLPAVRSSLEQELRLQREALTAARLEDSGICPVYDVGHDGAHAFLAMRYVEGETLAACIEAARARPGPAQPVLPLPQLLELFERLAASLHRAHQAGVVHRDLKPGNIMLGDDGQPVLLDFGLAADTETDGPLLTRSGDVFGTPGYLPPERLLGHGRGGDRRWDVWALGVSLYEACTLQRPFQAPTLDGLYRAILGDEPPPARRLVPSLPKDLAAVLAVCLEKVPERRYQTMADLGADLRAVRLHEPIRARPPSAWRKLRRWHRRHAVLATALWLALAGLFAVIQVQHAMLDEVRSAHDEAQRLNDFLVEKLLLSVTPREARGRDLTAAEIFDRAGANVATSFPTPTRTGGMLQHVLGRAYRQLGRKPEARAAFEQAVAIRTAVLGPDARETLQSRRELALVRMGRDDIDGALGELRAVLVATVAGFGAADDDVFEARAALSEMLLFAGRHQEAEQEARLVLAGRAAARSPDHPSVLTARHWLGRCLEKQGRRGDAEPVFREVLAARRRALGPDAIEVEQSMNDLATLLHDRASYEKLDGKWAEAEAAYTEDLALAQKLYPKTNPAYATVVNNVASFFSDRSAQVADPQQKADYERRAESLFRESLALRESIDGPESSRVATVCCNLCSLLAHLQRYDEALAMVDRALQIRTRVFGERHRDTIGALNNRAVLLRQWRGAEAALPDAREVLARAQANPELDQTTRNLFERGLVVLLEAAHRDEEHVAAATAFWPRAVAQWGAGSSVVRELAGVTVRALRRLGREPEAAVWAERAKEPAKAPVPDPDGGR